MQEFFKMQLGRLGAPVSFDTKEKSFFYRLEKGWGVSSSGRILEFSLEEREWQIHNRTFFCVVKNIDENTLRSEVITKIVDFRHLIIDTFTIDVLNYKIDDEDFEIIETKKGNIINFHGWKIDINKKEILDTGEDDEIIKNKSIAILKAFYTDEKFLDKKSYIDPKYFLRDITQNQQP